MLGPEGFSAELIAAEGDWLEDSPSMKVTRAVLRYLLSSTVLASWTCSVSHPRFTPVHRGELAGPELAIACGEVVPVLPMYLISLQNSPLTRCPENPTGRSTF